MFKYLKIIINNMTKEFEEYTNKLMSLQKLDIINNSYEYAIKKELFEMFKSAYYYEYYLCISDYNLDKLSKIKYPLSFIYDEWLKTDLNINSQLNEFLDCCNF